MKVAHDKEKDIKIDSSNLYDYVGKPVFSSEKMYPETPSGVALGLAWTSLGGSTLYIETVGQSVKEAGTGGGLEVTGNLGDVMKERLRRDSDKAEQELQMHPPEKHGAVGHDFPTRLCMLKLKHHCQGIGCNTSIL